MECEKEACPFCNKVKVMGKEKVMDMCLHTICSECHDSKRAELCPLCVAKNKRKFLNEDGDNEKHAKEKVC